MQDYLGDYLPVIAAAALVTLLHHAAVPAALVPGRRRAGARRAPRAHPPHRAARRRRDPRRLPQRDVRRLAVATASRRCSSRAPCPLGVVLAALVIFTVGQVDDLREVSPPAKVAGTVLAGSVLSISGVSILFFRIPFAGLVSLSPDMSALLTVLWVLGMTTAINYIDGLDGLAAGIVAIAAAALLVYCERLHTRGRHRPRQRRAAHRRRGARRVPRLPAAQLPPRQDLHGRRRRAAARAAARRRSRSPSAATPTRRSPARRSSSSPRSSSRS